MFRKRISIALIATLIAALFSPIGLFGRAYAVTQTLSLDPQADLLWDSEYGTLDNDTAGRFYAGKYLYEGVPVISRGGLRFNLAQFRERPLNMN
ncbi:hypothetical protein SD71_12635 [Cohnella kolymensis]|uniref:Uncharacterized protein n=1 Tax=Cohnella kolymensis TaxID=1590652 RepID=A0ABR5A3F2_9BACL|nr:hypothetical protein [Cohnella kolymensis]KIL35591.1 hypothetical protein SD71_12635 [Cohnella kolymensis]